MALLCPSPSAGRAQAALPADTRIVVTGCTSHINQRTLHDQVRIELLAAGVQRVRTVELYADDVKLEEEPEEVATLRIQLSDCEEVAGDVRLGVAARRTGKHIERRLAISDMPESMHARAIALALTELLRASWLDLTVAQTREPPRDAELPIPSLDAPLLRAGQIMAQDARRAFERSLRKRLRLEWQGGGRVYPQTSSADISSAFALSKLFGERTRLQFAASAAGGAGQGSDAHLFQAVGRITAAICSQRNSPAVEVGSTLEAGWAYLRGTDAGHKGGVVTTALLQALLRVQAAQEVEALVGLQVGYVLAPVTLRAPAEEGGPRGPKVGFQGPTIGLSVGLAGLL